MGSSSSRNEQADSSINRMPDKPIRSRGDQTAFRWIRGTMEAAATKSHSRPDHQRNCGDLRGNDKWGRRKETPGEQQTNNSSHHRKIADH